LVTTSLIGSEFTTKLMENWEPMLVPRNAWSPVDEALFGPQDLFAVPAADAEELRLRAIQHSLDYHFETNKFYRALCKDRGFEPKDVKTVDDLKKVPLIPDTIFKGYRNPSEFVQWLKGLSPDNMQYPQVKDQSSFDSVIRELQDGGVTVLFSSGTSGRFTFVPRDDLTWRRLRYAICMPTLHIAPICFELLTTPGERNVMMGLPNPRRTNLFIGRVGAAVWDFFPDISFHFTSDREVTTKLIRLSQGQASGLRDKALAGIVKRAVVRETAKADDRMIELVKSLAKEHNGGALIGPPFWVARLLSKIEASLGSISLGDRWVIVTGGGWKLMESTRVAEKKFRERVTSTLGIPDQNFRDLYGMVECNVLFPSCEGHYKHIPSTVLHPFVLDEAFDPLPWGQPGRFAFIDPLANSYPGFVTTGDRVRIFEHCPACDRPGPVIDQEVTRMPGVEDRGCATVLRRLLEDETMSP